MGADPGDKAKKLKEACDQAFHTYPDSCSHSVWYVVSRYDSNFPYMPANQLVAYLQANPKWKEVQLVELSKLANEGVLVVGGLNEKTHGHVIVVYPGHEKQDGGFNFNGPNGKQVKAPPHGTYALAMSTSLGSWPGAKSKGDRTVRDPWGEKAFQGVKFWKYLGP
jgi:hypothetical protein